MNRKNKPAVSMPKKVIMTALQIVAGFFGAGAAAGLLAAWALEFGFAWVWTVRFTAIGLAAAAGLIITTIFCFAWVGRPEEQEEEIDIDPETGNPVSVLKEKLVLVMPIEILLLIDIFILIFGGLAAGAGCVSLAMLAYDSNPWVFVGAGALAGVATIILLDLVAYPLLIKSKHNASTKNSLVKMLVTSLVKGAHNSAEHRKATKKTTMLYVLAIIIVAFLIFTVTIVTARGFAIFLLVVAAIGAYLYMNRMLVSRQRLKDGIDEIAGGNFDYQIDTEGMSANDKETAYSVNQIKNGMEKALAEQVKTERLRTELITNVSHDLKTPLTSIINYVDLLKREDLNNEKAAGYLEVLERQAQRLKSLTEDLVEVSKISSGNVTLDMMKLDVRQLLGQVAVEFQDRFEVRNMTVLQTIQKEPMYIMADGRRLCRVFENLLGNAAKYGMPGTRVYINAYSMDGKVKIAIKNVSEIVLNVAPEELMERFVRGDESRTTQGAGLGLEIAKSLTTLQKGSFNLKIDGDLFTVELEFDELV